MYVITYSLREDQLHSEHYYQDIALFTDEVLLEMENLTHDIIEGYLSYLNGDAAHKLHKKEEYGFELLILGTLWKVYSGDASKLDEVPRQFLSKLAAFRRQGGSLKPGIDFIRGIMSTLFLSPDLYDNMFMLDATPEHLQKLLNWLDATGEFNQEVKCLNGWLDYLKTLPQKDASDIIAAAITLAVWFEIRSEEALGKYTQNVERYLNEMRPEHYWSEDVIFCGRRRVEYHLSMVGAEIMNRAFREAFLNTSRKTVLLPACMRLLPASKCRAHLSGGGLICTRCTPGCAVNKITELGIENGFDVVIASHESSISAAKNDGTFLDKETGTVGVACVLNLISGGLMLRDMGIPAQCVLLDYCGCSNHWSKEGLPTELNLSQLKKVLGLN